MPQVPSNEAVRPPTAPYSYSRYERVTASDKQLAQAAYNAGFRGSALVTAVAVGLAESRGNVNALNNKREFSVGVWQINLEGYLGKRLKRFKLDSWTDLFNLQNNANAAYNVSGQGRHFGAWSVYKHGSYLKYMDRANAAAHAVTGQAPVDIPSGTGAGYTNSDITIAARLVRWLAFSDLNDLGLGITWNRTWAEQIKIIRNGTNPLIGTKKDPDPEAAQYLTDFLASKNIPLESNISQSSFSSIVSALSRVGGVPDPVINEPSDLLNGAFDWVQPLLDPIAHGFYFLIFIIIAIALLIVGVMAAKQKKE